MSEFIIYNVPTTDNPNRTIVSIPDAVQLDSTTNSITIEQTQPTQTTNPLVVETLGEPSVSSSIVIAEDGYQLSSDSLTGPVFASGVAQAASQRIPADRNIFEIDLLPNSDVSIIPALEGTLYRPAAEVKRIEIPDGFVPIEDITPLEKYAYSLALLKGGPGFTPLAGMTPVPTAPYYEIEASPNGNITIHGSEFIDSVRIDWCRQNRADGQLDWTTYGHFELSETEGYKTQAPHWDMSGRFILRAVPYHKGYPLPLYKERILKYEKGYRLKLEGYHHGPTDTISIFEKGQFLAQEKLFLDNMGYISQIIDVNNVSSDISPRLEIRWYKECPIGYSHYYTTYERVHSNFAQENISLTATKNGNNEFIFQLKSPEGKMYNPPSVINALSIENGGWQIACQTKKEMVYLEICRHQRGQKTSYGYYLLNITQGSSPEFLEEAGFQLLNKIRDGFEFSWSDTAHFRQLANVDAPDTLLPLEYEFRLVHWTAGIEQSIRANEEYAFLKEVSTRASGETFLHRYRYNTWTNEHPSVKYYNLNPPRLKKSGGSNLRYGRSKKAAILSSIPFPQEVTTNISINTSLGWEVLYEIDHDQQEVKQYPFYKMIINVPATTLDHVNEIRVFLEGTGELIGRYHPSLRICVIDFLGYYRLRQMVIESTDLDSVYQQIEDSNPERRLNRSRNSGRSGVAEIRSERTNTKEKTMAVKKAETNANQAVAERAVTLPVNYRVEVHFNNGKMEPHTIGAATDGIPIIPQEKEDNTAFAMGNPVIDPKAYNIDAGFSENLANAISSSPIVDEGRLETTAVIIDQSLDGFGVFR